MLQIYIDIHLKYSYTPNHRKGGSKMMYIYEPEKLDELLDAIKDDDSITITGRQLRELAETIRKKVRDANRSLSMRICSIRS